MQVKDTHIIDKVKEIANRYDANATVTLFGSRARGDYEEESDWDFLILTNKESRDELIQLEKHIRNDVFDEIEMISFDIVQTIIRNKKVWENDLWMTPLFESIKEEGKVV